MNLLPVELVQRILDLTSDEDLRCASRVSRRLRAIALSNSRFYLPWDVDLDQKKPNPDGADEKDGIAKYVQKHSLPVGVTVSSILSGDRYMAFLRTDVFTQLDSLLHLLVKLEIRIPDGCVADFDEIRRRPAPLLRDLSVASYAFHSPPVAMPSSILSGSAPRLVHLSLEDVTFPSEPIAVFSRVEHLTLCYRRRPPSFNAACHFPSLRRISFQTITDDRLRDIDFRGIRHLDRVDLFTDSKPHAFPRAFWECLPRTRVIAFSLEDICFFGSDQLSTLMLNGPLEMHLGDAASTSSETPARRRFLCVRGSDDSGVQLALQYSTHTWNTRAPPYARLADLRLPFALLRLFRLTCSSADTFPILRRLHLDAPRTGIMRWHSDIYAPLVQCPALQILCLFGPATAARASIPVEDAAGLGRTLGQSYRLPVARARLELVNVDFTSPSLGQELQDVFSAVVHKDWEADVLDLSISWD